MSELSEFLDIRVGDVEVPQVLPSGVFKCIITRYGIDRAKNEKRTPFVRVTLKPVDVVECEDEVNLNSTRTISSDFWRTPAADKITLDFFERKLGMEIGKDDRFGELWESALGAEVICEVKQSISKKGNPYAEVVRFLKVD